MVKDVVLKSRETTMLIDPPEVNIHCSMWQKWCELSIGVGLFRVKGPGG